MQGGGCLNDKEYFLLNEFICSRHDSCEKCPLNKYDDCDVEPTSQEIVEVAKRIIDLPNSDELMIAHEDEEKAREILARYRKAAVI